MANNRSIRLGTLAVIGLGCLLLGGVATAADTAAASSNSQQTKMKSCNADAKAKNLTGDDRKAYMKTCLSNAPASAAPAAAAPLNSQQQKMKDCNAQAKTQSLSGDARKQFMSSCLKGS